MLSAVTPIYHWIPFKRAALASRLCRIANERLVFSYTDRSGNPDFEQHMLDLPELLTYGRYHDDILMVVTADSLEDALAYAKQKLPAPVRIEFTWEGSDWISGHTVRLLTISNESPGLRHTLFG
ncbi:hypothetical protein BDD12DRAFT_885335 [Trichophaea hybrida]|nr:hypothetical protein BDD12DRAFT_885335 [Trichophaea hybrida]